MQESPPTPPIVEPRTAPTTEFGRFTAPEFRPAVFPVADPRDERARRRRSRRWLGSAAQVFGLCAIFYLCLFNLSVVRGSSMAPRIHDGDRILIDHLTYLFHSIERGDIVVLKYPLDPSVDYIKRVIGLPGDEIDIERGSVRVNGDVVQEPYVGSNDYLARMHVKVEPAHYFVLGDNRPRSCDSREFGFVPADYVRGKVELRVWPPSRVGVIDPER